jgi:hypothetical protein
MLPCSAEREHNGGRRACIDELAPDLRADPHDLIGPKATGLALEKQRELSLEDEVHLLLPLMSMHTSPLSRLKGDEVDAERLDAELTSKKLKALLWIRFEIDDGDGVGHSVSLHTGSTGNRPTGEQAVEAHTPAGAPSSASSRSELRSAAVRLA